MYARGHEHGTRRQSRTQSAWYAAIEQATLAQLDATWTDSNSTPQEVPSAQTPSDAVPQSPSVINPITQ